MNQAEDSNETMTNNLMTDGEEGEKRLNYAEPPRTRSKGKVEEYTWVMGRALEHAKKGRPKFEGN